MESKGCEASYVVSLRVTHPELSAAMIMEMLSVTPQISQSVGEERRTPKGQRLDGTYRRTYLSASIVEKTSGYLVEGIERSIDSLSCKRRELATISETGGRCELFIGVFSGENLEFELDHALMKMLNECSLGISIDAYFEREDGGCLPSSAAQARTLIE